MILADTSIWIDHFRQSDEVFGQLLIDRRIALHPFVMGELALGNFTDFDQVTIELAKIEPAPVADVAGVLRMIVELDLAGAGIGYVDAHLIAAARLMNGGQLWTRDKRLHAVAKRLSLAFDSEGKVV